MPTTSDEATHDRDARTRPVHEDALHHAPVRFGGAELRAWMDGILNRHPAVGLAVGIVRGGSLELFDGRGFADIASKRPDRKSVV